MGTIACADIRADLPNIACPTLVITTEESGLGDGRRDPRLAADRSRDSELIVLPGNSYHVAATHADQSARATSTLSPAGAASTDDRYKAWLGPTYSIRVANPADSSGQLLAGG